MELNGAQLGRYHIIGLIGQGGMGAVYRAWCTRMEREVALKVLPPGLASDTRARRQLEREAAMLARIRHPGVVRVLDVDEQCGTTFYVMEMIADPTLASLLDWRGSLGGRLPVRYACGLLLSLLDVVQAMHACDVVHRDLKPANVFVSSRGQVRLCDFGLACDVSIDCDTSTDGLTSGTLAYMAPEQLLGDTPDARTDVYALGLILYRMLAGHLPFESTVAAVSHAKLGMDRLKDIRDLKVDVPDSLAQVAQKACARDANERFQSAAEMHAALKAALVDYSDENAAKTARRLRRTRGAEAIPEPVLPLAEPPNYEQLAARITGMTVGFLLATLVMRCFGI